MKSEEKDNYTEGMEICVLHLISTRKISSMLSFLGKAAPTTVLPRIFPYHASLVKVHYSIDAIQEPMALQSAILSVWCDG